MDKLIIKKIQQLKKKYYKDGFIILGVFGSYARDEETNESDIDILYELSEDFYNRYVGWEVCTAIVDIKKEIESELGIKIDLANRRALDDIGKKYILPEVVYV